jgi:Mg-chelatase subunit ChlD
MLCIEVSGSMTGVQLVKAVRGTGQFVAEAVAWNYKVGVIPWGTGVADLAEPTSDGRAATAVLDSAHIYGDTHPLPALVWCHQILAAFTGDRVVAVFGDGDLGSPHQPVLDQVARMKAENIRFVTRRLGSYAARGFGEISDEEASAATIEEVSDLADGIADVTTSLKGYGLTQ